MTTLTKKDLLEAIEDMILEMTPMAEDVFNREGDYYLGKREALIEVKQMIENLESC